MPLHDYLLTDPDKFVAALNQESDPFSQQTANNLDDNDPIIHQSRENFAIGELIPLAGHSLGPAFIPALEAIQRVHEIQKTLHAGHFPDSHPDGANSGHWFDCDRHRPSLLAAQKLLGFKELHEFNFTNAGLSDNLRILVDTFYRLTKENWQSKKNKVFMLGKDFFSDQSIVFSAVDRTIDVAVGFEIFSEEDIPSAKDLILKIEPNQDGIYNIEALIEMISENAHQLQMICLSDIVFCTGQRLKLDYVLGKLKKIIQDNGIIVILDLAHTIANRSINLEALEVVTGAVGCAYKHACGYAGSSFGLYVNRRADLKKYKPIQGWKAADPDRVFPVINGFDEEIMNSHEGAVAFRASNPPPVSLMPIQSYLQFLNSIGFDKLVNRSECLTRYMVILLQNKLSDKIEFITPLAPIERGATICFKTKEQYDVRKIEELLKKNGFEIDTRPPNIIRVTAHYAYTRFSDIYSFVSSLHHILQYQQIDSPAKISAKIGLMPSPTDNMPMNTVDTASPLSSPASSSRT